MPTRVTPDATGRRLRVAGLGAGYFAQFHYRAWSRLDAVDLVGICDSDEAKATATADALTSQADVGDNGGQAQGIAADGQPTDTVAASAQWMQRWLQHGSRLVWTDAATMLRDLTGASGKPIDILDIITPPETHLQLVRLACESLVPTVICQKPLAPTLAEAAEIVELAEKFPDTKLVVHENFRWQPWYGEMRRLLHGENAIGRCFNAVFRLRPGDGQGTPPSYVSRQPYFADMERFVIHETVRSTLRTHALMHPI